MELELGLGFGVGKGGWNIGAMIMGTAFVVIFVVLFRLM